MSEDAPSVARARSTDPSTSHQAARAVEASGEAQRQRDACLACVRCFPGLTAAEVSQRLGLERHAASRRLPELRTDNLVANGTPRRCTVLNRWTMTWFPVSAISTNGVP